jgi:hypothetical protein
VIEGLPQGFEKGANSVERDIQKERELVVLQALFFNKDYVSKNKLHFICRFATRSNLNICLMKGRACCINFWYPGIILSFNIRLI